MRAILLILLTFYPYCVSLSTPEAEPGAVVIATISAPAGSAVGLDAPAFITIGPIVYYGGGSDTYSATLTIADDAPMSRLPVTIGLVVDGVEVDRVNVRIWTEGVVRYDVWLPMIEKE